MGRWLPDARGRLQRAALELYTERGFEETTVADISDRAGVTERTFFRHFADKREALFAGSEELQRTIVEAVESAPVALTPLEVTDRALAAAAPLLGESHAYATKRSAAIAANPGLLERELLKLATLSGAMADALRRRGVPDPAASLAAETGITVFKVAYERWVQDTSPPKLGACFEQVSAELRSLNTQGSTE